MSTPTRKFAHIALTVSDLDNSISFYRSLGFNVEWQTEISGTQVAQLYGLARARARAAYLTLGPNGLELFQFLDPHGGRDIAKVMRPYDRGVMHIAVLVEDVDQVHKMLTDLNYESYSPPVTMPGGSRAVMIRDPDGIAVEFFQPAS